MNKRFSKKKNIRGVPKPKLQVALKHVDMQVHNPGTQVPLPGAKAFYNIFRSSRLCTIPSGSLGNSQSWKPSTGL